MAFFKNLFGKKPDQPGLSKTSEMLNEDLYWSLIHRSLQQTEDQELQEQFLLKELEKLTPSEIIGFSLRTDQLLYDTYSSEMWCAAYVINGGCSDDSFEYFRRWLISRGKEAYYKAKEHPDNLAGIAQEGDEHDFEGFSYIPLQAFENKTGKQLNDFVDLEKFTTHEGNYPEIEFTWEEDKPESMKAICPKLFEKFWAK